MKFMYGLDDRRNVSFRAINVGVRRIRFQGESGVVIVPLYMNSVSLDIFFVIYQQ